MAKHDDERARITARLTELDQLLDQLNHMVAANRAVLMHRNCRMEAKVNSLRAALHVLKGEPQ